MTPEPIGVPHPFDSEYFGWMPGDVEWEKPPKTPPPMPPAPKGQPPATVPDFYSRPTGAELFETMSKAEQDEALGPEIAAAVRDGSVVLSDLVVRNPMETEPDFITQASPVDLGLDEKKGSDAS